MHTSPRRTQTLAERLTVDGVIRRWPHTAQIFGRHRINTCRGDASLAEAAARDGVDLDALLTEIFEEMWQGS